MDRRHFLQSSVISVAAPNASNALAAIAQIPASAMAQRTIPSTQEKIAVIGLGTWQTFDVGTTVAERSPLREVSQAFHARGGKMIDSSPELKGSALLVLV